MLNIKGFGYNNFEVNKYLYLYDTIKFEFVYAYGCRFSDLFR